MNLTERQRRFAEEYAVDANGTQAAIRAGYSVRSAAAAASRLLRKRNIQDLLTELGQPRRVTAERVVNELAAIGFGTGRLGARTRALEILAKYLGLFRPDRLAIAGVNGAPVRTVTTVVFGGRYRPDGSHVTA